MRSDCYRDDANLAASPAQSIELSGRLLNTAACLQISHQVHEFETGILGSDFQNSAEEYAHWFASGNLFYAAISQSSGPGLSVIQAIVSVFVADAESCVQFVQGEILEHELQPWKPVCGPSSAAIFYFSTIICANRGWLPTLYLSLFQDLQQFKRCHDPVVPLGLSIAASSKGVKHLAKNGFLSTGRKYLKEHGIFIVTAASARSPFWQCLLDRPEGVAPFLSQFEST